MKKSFDPYRSVYILNFKAEDYMIWCKSSDLSGAIRLFQQPPLDGFPDERVHRYNAEGLAGLADRTVPQRPRRLAPDQLAALAAWVEAGRARGLG